MSGLNGFVSFGHVISFWISQWVPYVQHYLRTFYIQALIIHCTLQQ